MSYQPNLANPVNYSSGLNSGLVNWWRALPGRLGGTVWYDLAGRNHGTLLNFNFANVGWRTVARPGASHALLFDGADDWVSTGARVGPQTGFSAAAWIFAPNINNRDIASQFSAGNAYFQMSVLVSGAVQCRIFQTQAIFIGRVTNASIIAANTWRHVAMTWNGGTTAAAIRVYIDGVQLDTTDGNAGSFTAPSAAAVEFEIGSLGAGAFNRWFGFLDDVRTWRRPLSAGEVQAVMTDSRQGYPLTLNRRRVA